MTVYTFLEGSRPEFLTDRIPQIIALYRQNNWWGAAADDPEMISQIVQGSHCFIVAEKGARVIGMGRAISDRASDAYIQDVTVARTHQGMGIGTELIRRMVARLERDGIGWIGLIAERHSHPFYERIGFRPMPDAVAMLKGGP